MLHFLVHCLVYISRPGQLQHRYCYLVHETKEQVVDILKQVGFVTDEIPASVAMERINTLAISNECIDKVKNAYDYIIQEGAIK